MMISRGRRTTRMQGACGVVHEGEGGVGEEGQVMNDEDIGNDV
jgi:hypothetical protein